LDFELVRASLGIAKQVYFEVFFSLIEFFVVK